MQAPRIKTPAASRQPNLPAQPTGPVEKSRPLLTLKIGPCEQPPSHQTQYPRLHELAHALGVRYAQYGRRRAEVIVDCVTYIVCAGVGLDVGGESIPYIAGWGENGAIEAVSGFAQTIDNVARQLEDALADPDSGPDDNEPSAAAPADPALPLAA